MAEFTEEQARMLTETHSAVLTIKTILMDTNGNRGLASKVEESCKRQDRQEEEYNKLKRNFWMLVAFLIGSGVISASVITALNITGG